jgi:tRNA modification GTPase
MNGKSLYHGSDTIAAISTGVGESGIGIIKLSGPKAVGIAERIFRAKNKIKIKQMGSFTMSYGLIVDKNGQVIDEVIISFMKKPRSYTREDVVEINCHGGLTAVKKVMEMCIENGARCAEPGEFTKRAFLNGRIDLTQAEAIIEIVRAKTDESLKIAAKNLKGAVKNKIENLKKAVLDVIVELEASIDFIEEDLEITPYEELAKKVKNINDEIEILIEDEKRGEIIKNGFKVAIVGKPNVGKSSLLNALARKERAIVTHIPGTTRDAIEEILYVEGMPLRIIDTAGIRKARNIIEKIGVEKSFNHIEDSDLILMVIDASNELEERDYDIVKKIENKKIIVCLNKIDLKKVANLNSLSNKNIEAIVEISAKKSIGIEKLEKIIKKTAMGEDSFLLENKIIVNQRQKEILTEAKTAIKNALKAMKEKMSEEFPVSDLRVSYNLLCDITGKAGNEDIMNEIFSKFCIGK